MAAADPVDLEIRAAAHVVSDIAVEMAADEFDTRAFEGDAARIIPVEIGVAAVRIQQKAEADEDAARSGAGIFARSQVGGGGRSGRECDQSKGQPIRPATLNTLTRLCFFRLYEGQYVVCWRCLKAIFPNARPAFDQGGPL